MRLVPIVVSLVMLGGSCWSRSGSARAAEVIDFQPTVEFLKLPDGWTLGPCSAVAVSRKGEIYLLHRGKHPVLCFDANGKFLRSWGDDLIKSASSFSRIIHRALSSDPGIHSIRWHLEDDFKAGRSEGAPTPTG